MNLQEIKDRYRRAREQAIREIDDLSQGADPAQVYRAVEIAVVWKVVLATEGKLTINLDVLDELLGPTNGHGEHQPVTADLPRAEAQRRSNYNARMERENEARKKESGG